MFHALDPGKQGRIVDAALVEFGEKGFERASTNAIVERAGIGKGMLFYYFGSKTELFEFVYDYAIEYLTKEYLDLLATADSGDFLDRYERLTQIKRRAMTQSPQLFKFFESLYAPANDAYVDKCRRRIDDIRERVLQHLNEGLDYTLFRDDLAPERVVTYLKWLMNSYESDVTNRFRSGDFELGDERSIADEWTRFSAFLDDLRTAFYKETAHAHHQD